MVYEIIPKELGSISSLNISNKQPGARPFFIAQSSHSVKKRKSGTSNQITWPALLGAKGPREA